jgi:ribosomal protein S18 acetylase RimI-like enzyme
VCTPPTNKPRDHTADWLRLQLTRPENFAGFVIEHPADGVVCAALGSCDSWAPSPNNVGGSRGHVFNICTEAAHRRTGFAQACLGALLIWFHEDTGVRVVHFSATPEGAIIYRAAGFRETAFPSMRLQPDRLTES